jgi:hypothetical protein
VTELPAGTVRRHPEWPAAREIAMRTGFIDGQYPGWTSWIKVTPDGSTFTTPEAVADWPVVSLTDET